VGAFGPGPGAAARAGAVDRPDGDESVLVWEMPEPGMLSVRVTRPEELAEIRAPLTPALRPMLLGVTVILTPGAILNDFRTLNPMAVAPHLSSCSCPAQPESV
jgi:hypothetical protein